MYVKYSARAEETFIFLLLHILTEQYKSERFPFSKSFNFSLCSCVSIVCPQVVFHMISDHFARQGHMLLIIEPIIGNGLPIIWVITNIVSNFKTEIPQITAGLNDLAHGIQESRHFYISGH